MCTGLEVCRRCELWEELAADAPLDELRPCALCPDLWPAAALDPRTRLCPACKLEIQERQAAEADAPAPIEDVEALRHRAEERSRAEFEAARARLREMRERWGEAWELEDLIPYAWAP